MINISGVYLAMQCFILLYNLHNQGVSMKTVYKKMPLLSATIAFIGLGQPLFADETAPYLSIDAVGNININISITISNLAVGATYYLEQADSLFSNDWNEVHHVEGQPGETNWISATGHSGFYRAIQDPYHPKVGEAAIFTAYHHGVAGTAHIVNNRTLELRNFFYDAKGIDVQVYISPNPSFSPAISLSTNLVRAQPYTDETLSFVIPEGADLNDFNFISIWCVDIPVNFGDGPFRNTTR